MNIIKRHFISIITLALIIVLKYIFNINLLIILAIMTLLLLGFLIIFRNSFLEKLANISMISGNIEKAKNIYEKLLNKNIKSANTYCNLGIILLNEGDINKALELFNNSLNFKPEEMVYKNIKVNIATCYWLLGEVTKGIDTLESLIKEFDFINENIYTTLGFLYLLNNDTEKAITYSKKAVDIKEDYSSAWDNLGQIYLKIKDYKNAKKMFTEALKYNEYSVESNYYMGIIYELENNLELAKSQFNKANMCNISIFNTITKNDINQKLEHYS